MVTLALLMLDTTLGFFDFTPTSPANQRDNGDAVVALMFVLSGECVSCWMLALLMFLSPGHKRKPILAQLVTLLFSIVYSVGISYVTSTAKSQYLGNQLDIISLEAAYFVDTGFKVANSLGEALSYLAWLQIVVLMFAARYRNRIGGVWITVIIATLTVDIYYLVQLDLEEYLADIPPSIMRWWVARALLKQILLVMFAASLGWFTIHKKPTISYCRRLLPMSVFVWLVFAMHFVIYMLLMTKFRTNWLVRNWLATLPQYINIVLITLVWEWVLSIRSLERRIEHSGMLGRRMSYEDRISITSHAQVDNMKIKTGLLGRLLGNRKSVITNVTEENGLNVLPNPDDTVNGSKEFLWLDVQLSDTRSPDHREGTSRSINIPSSGDAISRNSDDDHDDNDNDHDDHDDNHGGIDIGYSNDIIGETMDDIMGEPMENDILGHNNDYGGADRSRYYGYTEDENDLDEEIIMTAGNMVSAYNRE
ncbi:uncharacterized protein KQ657_000519 [Scheffersomyces spartinae]|uniref:Uncharacterized protein n=1 Tax=Scheffersomyces spartinae TaxID=45513 RepID=A0A9P7V9E4_9ASCO|nr:uncharacterized protein KQ657_000519 [Scheffersomyces spartinae]KAG7193825.1 hypothetical protein KQ657_000519 [Scheffersomyces spartinae]